MTNHALADQRDSGGAASASRVGAAGIVRWPEGRMLWEAMKQADAHCDNEIIADCVCKLFAPDAQPSADTPAEPTIHRNGKAR